MDSSGFLCSLEFIQPVAYFFSKKWQPIYPLSLRKKEKYRRGTQSFKNKISGRSQHTPWELCLIQPHIPQAQYLAHSRCSGQVCQGGERILQPTTSCLWKNGCGEELGGGLCTLMALAAEALKRHFTLQPIPTVESALRGLCLDMRVL